MRKYNPQKIEKKWQDLWEKIGMHKTRDRLKGKDNFYQLVMFPYPSGDLHIGHWYNFVGSDVYARLKRMQGKNVLSPIGFDAFGLPAENAAIRRNIHPQNWTHKNIARMRKQLRTIGAVYDWSREVITSEPEYYKWTQWFFLQFYKKGLAYKKKAPANWCPKCKSILANEQAEDGKCWRCEGPVEQKEVEQWFFKITAFAEKLLKGLNDIDWPERTKLMQRNWIGKSEGTEIKFRVQIPNFKTEKEIKVFTTRPDTLFGCTYLVVSPEHPFIQEFKAKISNFKFVSQYIEEAKKKTGRERISEQKEKTGIELKGLKAVNPANNREIPIWLADYVLLDYGTGVIMAVPGHDQRDFDFAKKYNLPIIEVIVSRMPNISGGGPPVIVSGMLNISGGVPPVIKPLREELEKNPEALQGQGEKAYEGRGYLINSGRFNGLDSEVAKERISAYLAKENLAKKAVYYRLRDWLVSRQRYWGAPIPMIFCRKCGWQSVTEKELPVLLPKIRDFLPDQEGKSPLSKAEDFVNVSCPKCQGPGQRETDTMDTFICSSWYYLRYADPKNEKQFAAKGKLKAWLPVNMYVGGAEHAVLHLLYVRFFAKVLRDLGYIDFDEPVLSLKHQGIILGPDGQKMSKSKGNVVDPDKQVKKYGSDAVRMYLCFMCPYEQGGPWNPQGIEGVARFLKKVWDIFSQSPKSQTQNPELEKSVQKTIKKVTEDIENFRFNTAISSLMILVNQLRENREQLTRKNLKILLLLLAPFAPHLSEELWQEFIINSKFSIQKSIHSQDWPLYEPKLAREEKITLIIQVNGRVRDQIEVRFGISEKEAKDLALGRERIKKWLAGKEIKKAIFVPQKLINFVV